ncbi:2-succinyl-5-enolpyruvyl-6-hydroxy-3-cyclohexene-1-carboxylic-acid synthase [Siphonobacter sp. SORGH_AS_0500]|uniref:2-succinyl-5-enolpyruvyl-6-hydroxy-3- cyclohexene-1-carboxylic-acid synthase n=1 Tax=Siphonobacter sp. SORGH_AS_0500 TaxID=1864824 RepID=UPI000CC6BEB5|nr:2-succinyl-5-enolpyruvyl-6-hydroxy-3-cyclohexene-1-carboxylic-acid synthase [Siphonobacter sp. SORGH_AS_0500]PKK38304.1 2-succinyl-5-enolpyruvyl-6-hydroxy-3-cyclohexene-1-carboxylic-acid synthase [Siphonobacter sp. SORGH_AS_0500]
MILQPLLDLAELCVRRGITQAVISPGSRSAALTLAFARHPSIETKVIPDERAAAYIALGMAQQLNKPVVLICTSGTAALNFAPAVAEAYFLGVPLLVLTADRPPEWIYQQDGQMIHQDSVYGKHVKESISLPADYTHSDSLWFIERSVNQAIHTAEEDPKGPVHLNVPIREPFYPKADESYTYGSPKVILRSRGKTQLPVETWEELLQKIESTDRVLILAGQQVISRELLETLRQIKDELGIPVVGEVLSNLHGNFITHPDFFLASTHTDLLEELQPDLVISFGDAFVSKNLKLYLRKHKPKDHYHITSRRELIDPFQTLTHQLAVDKELFFKELLETLDLRAFRNGDDEIETEYLAHWEKAEQKSLQAIRSNFRLTEAFVEFKAIDEVMAVMPAHSQLHLANSMSVRYANFIGHERNITVFSNRGTSGIDGCLSTAVGAALTTDQLVFVLIGDVAFFYDRNALWHPHVPANLRIVLINNSGGSIFRMIEGPRQQPELETFFETRHQTSARNTAQDAGLHYEHVASYEELEKALPSFILEDENAKLLEISSNAEMNQNYFDHFKTLMKAL